MVWVDWKDVRFSVVLSNYGSVFFTILKKENGTDVSGIPYPD